MGVRSKDYKDRNLKSQAMEKIAKEMGWTEGGAEEVKKHVSSLRTSYTRELHKIRKSQSSGSGTSDVYEPTWQYFDLLDSFLRDVSLSKKSRNSMDLSIGEEEEQETDLDRDQSVKKVTPGPSKKSKRRIEDELLIISSAIECIKAPLPSIPINNFTSTAPDDDDICGRHIVACMRWIPAGRSKERLRLKVQQLILDAEYSLMDAHSFP